MAGSLTSATAVYMLTIPGVFSSPQQLQQFAADDIFSTEMLKSVEVSMGVDGILSGGFVFVPVVQSIMLQANSPSLEQFDQWWSAMQVAQETYTAQAVITLKSLGKKWAMTQGFLTGYMPIPDAGKTLKPRKMEITWQQAVPNPT